MRSTLKYFACALVLLLSIASVTLLALFNAASYRIAIDSYQAQGRQFTISNVNPNDNTDVLGYLSTQVQALQTVVTRSDTQLSDTDGTVSGTHISVLADSPEALANAPELSFLGTPLITRQNLADVLSAEKNKTLGIYQVEADQLYSLPEVAFGPNLSMGKLSDLIDTTQTVNGTYSIYGLSEDEFQVFLQGLSQVTGTAKENLVLPHSGGTTDSGILPLLAVAATLGITALLILVLFIYIMQGAKELGIHLLLGWSKTDYLVKLSKPLLYCSPVILITSIGGFWITLKGFSFNIKIFPLFIAPFILTIFIVFSSFIFTSLLLFRMKPIHAIRGYTPNTLFSALLAVFFVITSAGLYASAAYLDGPYKEVQRLSAVKQEWSQVADENILYSQKKGSDTSSFTNQSTAYATDFYKWYSSIEHQPGVSLVNTYYVDQTMLDLWRNNGEATPHREFWYMAASPSYLKNNGVELSSETIAKAESGEQVFIIPESFSATDQKEIRGWAQSVALRRGKSEQNIDTAFTKNPTTSATTYTTDKGLFTWNTDPNREFRSKDVVIYVATAANMTYFESESLIASSLSDSYVKLSPQATKLYTTSAYLAQFGLDDNQPTFIPTENFVAGLQKSITLYLQLFGVVTLLLGLLTALALGVFTNIYSLLNRNKIAVLRLLGHPLWTSFKPAYVLVTGISLFGLIAMILAMSRVGMIVAIIMVVLQPILLYLLARKFAHANTVKLIKES